MNAEVAQALKTDRVIDITTTGRKTGAKQRIEIWFLEHDDRVYITGRPGRRGWYANVVAEPRFVFHLKESVHADVDATARPITDADERRAAFDWILPEFGRGPEDLDAFMAGAPLVEVTFS